MPRLYCPVRLRPEMFPGIGVLPGPATEAVFATAEGITQQLSGPRVKLPPPVLQENGHIDTEYFSVLAAKEGEVLPTVRRAFQKTMSVSASSSAAECPGEEEPSAWEAPAAQISRIS
jgi:hypothetical protein